MKDRIPQYPGRVKLVPVAGQENIYDMTRADAPSVAGTPINKSTLLTDAHAALYGLDDTGTPDDALGILAHAVTVRDGALKKPDGTAMLLPSPTANMAVGSYVGTGSYGSSAPNTLTFGFAPRLLLLTSSRREPDSQTPVYWLLQYPDTEMRMHSNLSSGVTWGANSVSWWSDSISYAGEGVKSPGDAQLNESGVTYSYLALGTV